MNGRNKIMGNKYKRMKVIKEETVNDKETGIEEKQTKMPEQERRLSYAEWMTMLFKKFSKGMAVSYTHLDVYKRQHYKEKN